MRRGACSPKTRTAASAYLSLAALLSPGPGTRREGGRAGMTADSSPLGSMTCRRGPNIMPPGTEHFGQNWGPLEEGGFTLGVVSPGGDGDADADADADGEGRSLFPLERVAEVGYETLTFLYQCSEDVPCGRCVGDCDSDLECAGDLICQQRDANEEVQGCGSVSNGKWGVDYCASPTDGGEGGENYQPPPPSVEIIAGQEYSLMVYPASPDVDHEFYGFLLRASGVDGFDAGDVLSLLDGDNDGVGIQIMESGVETVGPKHVLGTCARDVSAACHTSSIGKGMAEVSLRIPEGRGEGILEVEVANFQWNHEWYWSRYQIRVVSPRKETTATTTAMATTTARTTVTTTGAAESDATAAVTVTTTTTESAATTVSTATATTTATMTAAISESDDPRDTFDSEGEQGGSGDIGGSKDVRNDGIGGVSVPSDDPASDDVALTVTSSSDDGGDVNVIKFDPFLTMEYAIANPDPSVGDGSRGTISITLSYRFEGWIALGIPHPDGPNSMVGDAVVGLPDEGGVYKYHLRSLSNVERMDDERQGTLMDASVVQAGDGRTIMRFKKFLVEEGELPIRVVYEEEESDVDGAGGSTRRRTAEATATQDLTFAYGMTNEFGYHGPSYGRMSVSLLASASEPVAATPSIVLDDAGYIRRRRMWTYHAVLGALAWGFLVPIAISFSWLRELLSQSTRSRWLTLHRSFNVLAVMLTIISFFLAVSVYASMGRRHLKGSAHERMGLAILILCLLQATGGIMRPPAAKKVSDETPNLTLVEMGVADAAADKAPPQNEDREEEGGRGQDKKDDERRPKPSSPSSILEERKRRIRRAWEIGHNILGLALLGCSLWQIDAGLVLYGSLYPTSTALTVGRGAYWAWIGIWALSSFTGKMTVMRRRSKGEAGRQR